MVDLPRQSHPPQEVRQVVSQREQLQPRLVGLERADPKNWTCPRFLHPLQRLHQSLGYKTPEQYEAENAPAIAA